MERNEFIEFEVIRSSISISSPDLFSAYIAEVHNDLTLRSEKSGIRKLIFYEYFKIPIFIAERLFNSFDKDGDELLNQREFAEGMFSLYQGNFEDTARIIFNMYDYDKDGSIYKGDVKVLLSYLPLKSQMDKLSHQLESLEELDNTINETFGNNNSLNFKSFEKVIENVKSDIYLLPICFLYQNKPFEENKINLFKNYKKRKSSSLNIRKSNDTKKRFPSPFKTSKFSSVEIFLEYTQNKKKSQSTDKSRISLFKMKSIPESQIKKQNKENKEMIRMNNKKILKDENVQYVYDSPSTYFKKSGTLPEELNLEPIECSTNYEFHLYLPDSSGKKLSKYYLTLVGKEISIYSNDSKTDLVHFHNLCGCYIKQEDGTQIFEKKKYYYFSIIFSKSISKKFFFPELDSMNEFLSVIKKCIGYINFEDVYEIGEEIGSGKFGIVKIGTHKHTGTKVAIKTFIKANLDSIELELIKSEMDQMKIFRHPNIVRLLDHFENVDYIFIVMEYLSGGDLLTIIKNNGIFSEARAANIIHKVALGVNYLNSLGIIHRDLKLENIMFIDNSQDSNVKIIDFGLTKTMAPGEKAYDKLGTLYYIAPEVIKVKPYDKQVDIWSIGVILYVMLSGNFPFCSASDSDQVIIRNTLNNQADFKNFDNVSKGAIRLIDQCLDKDPESRITCEDLLKSDWIRNNI
jgi:Ca2+-binding EF-hand superfamily protein